MLPALRPQGVIAITKGVKMLTKTDIQELAGFISDSIGNLNSAELAYGEYENAIVVHFPYKESHNASVESLDDAVFRVLKGANLEDIISDWVEDNREDIAAEIKE